MNPENWSEVVNVFGTITASGVMGLWIYTLIGEKKSLTDTNEKLSDYVRDSDKANLKLLGEMGHLLTTLMNNSDKLPEAVKDTVKQEGELIRSEIKNLENIIKSKND